MLQIKSTIQTLFTLSYWIYLLIVYPAVGLTTETKSINVIISAPRGGFGDTAANLAMAERLQAHLGNRFFIKLIVPPNTVEQVKVLWPEYDPLKDRQKIGAIQIENLNSATKADYVITFSAVNWIYGDPTFDEFKYGEKALLYLEYGEIERGRVSGLLTNFKIVKDEFGGPFKHPKHNGVTVNTGVNFGLYALKDFDDRKKLSTQQIIEELQKNNHPNIIGKNVSQTNSVLAYAYASTPEIVQQYADAANEWALRHNKFVILETNRSDLQLTGLNRTIVHSRPNLSFAEGQLLPKSSELPPLVNGDVSLSMAIEGYNPFLYSLYAWKRETVQLLLTELKKRSNLIKNDKNRFNLLVEMLSLDLSGTIDHRAQILNFFEDKELQIEISNVLKEMTENYSLADYIERDIDMLDNLKADVLQGPHLNLLFNLRRKYSSVQKIITVLESVIKKSTHKIDTRLTHLFALMSLVDCSKEKAAELLSTIITKITSKEKLRLRYILQDSASSGIFDDYLELLSEPAKKELYIAYSNLAAQDSKQWGGHVSKGLLKKQAILNLLQASTAQSDRCRDTLSKQTSND